MHSTDVAEKNILSLKINKIKAGEDNLFVIVGYADWKILGFDLTCNPLFEIDNGSQVSSIDFIDKDHFVTGSWDGCATVWKLSTKSKVSQFK